jgi:hypothetical protein
MTRRILYRYCLSALCLCLGAVTLLAVIGGRGRSFGVVHDCGDIGSAVSVVATSSEACQLFQKGGYRGRLVVSLSRNLHFVGLDSSKMFKPDGKRSLKSVDLRDEFARRLSPKNFLLILSRSGIARGVYNVLPAAIYREKVRSAPRDNIGSQRIEVDDTGSKRVVAMSLPRLTEPALIVVDASYFELESVDEFSAMLSRSGLKTDRVVFNAAEDNPEVTASARQQLRLAAARSAVAAALGKSRQ